MLGDISITALHAALNGLSARERAVSDDIANVNTPFFRGRRVAFEGDLRRALATGSNPLESAGPNVVLTNDPAGLNGNNVDLEAETLIGVETQMRYELALRATGDRFSLLRSAIRGA
jgi:flagellar basal-body rod protein FlgB